MEDSHCPLPLQNMFAPQLPQLVPHLVSKPHDLPSQSGTQTRHCAPQGELALPQSGAVICWNAQAFDRQIPGPLG
jgi:hypothetical protein